MDPVKQRPAVGKCFPSPLLVKMKGWMKPLGVHHLARVYTLLKFTPLDFSFKGRLKSQIQNDVIKKLSNEKAVHIVIDQ